MELQLDTRAVAAQQAGSPSKVRARKAIGSTKKSPRGPHGNQTRIQPLTRAALDGRTNAAKLYDRLVLDVEADLGGRENLSSIERALIEAFAGATVTMHNLNTRLLLGEQIDLSRHAQAVSAMVRVASRLGLQRRSRDVSSLSLADYLRQDADEAVEMAASDETRASDRAKGAVMAMDSKQSEPREQSCDGIDADTLARLARGEAV